MCVLWQTIMQLEKTEQSLQKRDKWHAAKKLQEHLLYRNNLFVLVYGELPINVNILLQLVIHVVLTIEYNCFFPRQKSSWAWIVFCEIDLVNKNSWCVELFENNTRLKEHEYLWFYFYYGVSRNAMISHINIPSDAPSDTNRNVWKLCKFDILKFWSYLVRKEVPMRHLLKLGCSDFRPHKIE